MEINNNICEDDKFKFVQGAFKLIGKDKDGIETVLVDDPNTVVRGSFTILSDLLTNPSSGKQIDTLKLGDGGIFENALLTPVFSDAQLYRETFSKTTFTDVSISSVGELSVTFLMVLGFSEGNGAGASLFSEAGLFSAEGDMFARKTFSEQFKTNEIEYTIKWTIIFK